MTQQEQVASYLKQHGPDGTRWKDQNQYQSAQMSAKKNVNALAEQITSSRGNFESIAASAQVPDGVGRGAADQAMIFSFAKMLDPRSVVRTEEGQAIARTDGYFGALQGFLKTIEGKGQLSADGRQGLVEEAYRQLLSKNLPVAERLMYENEAKRGMFGDLASPGVLGFKDWAEGYELPTYYGEGAQPGEPAPVVPALLNPETSPIAPASPGFDPDNPDTWLMPWEQ